MHTQLELVVEAALKLTPDEREALVQVLVASIEDENEFDDALAAEIERRNAEIESGVVQVIPMDEALAKVRASLK